MFFRPFRYKPPSTHHKGKIIPTQISSMQQKEKIYQAKLTWTLHKFRDSEGNLKRRTEISVIMCSESG
jgi:hypothetical protein